MNRMRPTARFLMCRPDHFAVSYTINPWMDPNSWARHRRSLASTSRREWEGLYRNMTDLGAQIELVTPAPALPDLVFTANGAVVLDRKALLARFRHAERRAEEPHFETAFRRLVDCGLIDTVARMPENLVLEGAGDCVWDDVRKTFWMGYGQRSDAAAQEIVKCEFGVDVIALQLADPRFYHMDTAFRPLPRGEVIYYPSAFTAAGRAAIEHRVDSDKRIAIKFDDAGRLAANSVSIRDSLLLSNCSNQLRAMLEERGYRIVATPLGAFLRSGGSAFCLTLRLDHCSAATSLQAQELAGRTAALARIA
jgi:N-dimethylarginine dimethylaminohydrolase